MPARTNASTKVLAWLQKGRSCDMFIAEKNLQLTHAQYLAAMKTIRANGHIVDRDQKSKVVHGVRKYYVSHQLLDPRAKLKRTPA